jgi:hypothetical protein
MNTYISMKIGGMETVDSDLNTIEDIGKTVITFMI